MDFDQVRFAQANVRGAFGLRRRYLAALDAALCERREALCGVVVRDGVPLLRVTLPGAALRVIEVDCEQGTDGWVFTRADTKEPIGPVSDPAAVAGRLAEALNRRTVR